MIYAKKIVMPSELAEIKVIENEKRTCFNTFYPFKIFPEKQLSHIDFDGITMLYGGNGSGKSTLINVIARKINAIRYSEFNGAPLFDKYTEMCSVEYFRMPPRSYVLTSDDVFDYVLNARFVNEGIDDRRNELFDEYIATHREAVINPDIMPRFSFRDPQLLTTWSGAHFSSSLHGLFPIFIFPFLIVTLRHSSCSNSL